MLYPLIEVSKNCDLTLTSRFLRDFHECLCEIGLLAQTLAAIPCWRVFGQVHCLNNAPVFVISTGVITLSINIAYLSFTAYLFFSLRTSIQKYTEYEPSPVLITTAVLGTSLALVLIAAFLTIFTKKRGDTLYVRHFDDNESEGNKDTEKGPIYHSEDIASNLSKDVNHSEEPGYVEKVKRLEDWRDVIESEEEEDRNSEEAATVEMQLRFISNPKYDPFKPEEVEKRRKVELKKPGADLTQNAKNNKGRNPLISKEPKAPHPEDEFHEVH